MTKALIVCTDEEITAEDTTHHSLSYCPHDMSTSSGNSPHRFSGSVDAFYDPDFTADISKKMRVPEKIMMETNSHYNHFDDPAIIAAKSQASDRPNWMTVPERILVMG
jgi:hypothetical protein